MNKRIKPTYGKMSEEEYTAKINSPSKDISYFERFHGRYIDEAKEGTEDGRVKVLDIGCGHGHEFDFFKSDPDVFIVGVDLSISTLQSAIKERLAGTGLVAADIREMPIKDESIDFGIALNAVVYEPEAMLKVLYCALKKGAKCAVNFRVYPKNSAFYEYYLNMGGKLLDKDIVVSTGDNEERFTLKVLDYNECEDEKIRNLDQQIYFQSEEDIERFVRAMGFDIDNHELFEFSSVANPKNEIDVYILRKPE